MKYQIEGNEDENLFKLIGKTIKQVMIVENKTRHLWKRLGDDDSISSGSNSVNIVFETTDGLKIEI